MTEKKEHWLKSPWTISIATAIFSMLLSMCNDYLKEKPILSTVWTLLKWFGNLFWAVINFDLKVWWVISAIILLSIILFLIDKFKAKGTNQPDFYSYREGKFKKWKWTWSWTWIEEIDRWKILDLKAHCPKCDTPLINRSTIYIYSFDCPRCDFRAIEDQCDEPLKIEKIIYDNIERQRNEKNNSK